MSLPYPPSWLNPYQPLSPPPRVRHKVFISYHHADETEVAAFVRAFDHFGDAFIARGLGAGMSEDIINSNDTDYVMRRIREQYLGSSTVTIVMIGNCTWARRYVDWELQASLRSGPQTTPNGVLGIRLGSYNNTGYPERLNQNLLPPGVPQPVRDCYARVFPMPQQIGILVSHIEDAFQARTTRHNLIVNPQQRMGYNRNCGHTWH